MYENSELKVFKNVNILGEISSNLPKDLLGTKARLLSLVDNHCERYYSKLILLL